MKCVRCIKYYRVKWVRKNRKLYMDDKGTMHTLEQGMEHYRHEQRKVSPKGDSRRRGIYG